MEIQGTELATPYTPANLDKPREICANKGKHCIFVGTQLCLLGGLVPLTMHILIENVTGKCFVLRQCVRQRLNRIED